MNFLKKNTKTIAGIIVGAVLATGITGYATYNYFAKDITYKRPGTNTEINVAQALNELYTSKQTANASGSANNYSTEEQVIGTWIDNNKLYRKTYTATLSSTDATQVISVDNSFDVKSIEAIIFNGTVRIPSGFFDGSNRFCAGIDNHRICLMRNSAGAWAGCTSYITIEYTKTTDSAITN